MTDEKALVNIDTSKSSIQVKQEDAGELAKLVASGDYLSRLQLMTANSDKCKQGQFPINHYAIIRDQTFNDLGETVDVLVIAWRPKALDLGGEELISSFDQECATFKDIEARSANKDSGCMYGPEFLLWIPETEQFVTFFMGTKSARKEAPNVITRLQKAGTLSSKLIETSKYKWQAAIMQACSTPFDMPPQEDLQKEVDKFLNPKESDLEIAEDGGEERAR